jgi:hypothetical protein
VELILLAVHCKDDAEAIDGAAHAPRIAADNTETSVRPLDRFRADQLDLIDWRIDRCD